MIRIFCAFTGSSGLSTRLNENRGIRDVRTIRTGMYRDRMQFEFGNKANTGSKDKE